MTGYNQFIILFSSWIFLQQNLGNWQDEGVILFNGDIVEDLQNCKDHNYKIWRYNL